MRISIITLFPEFFSGPLETSIVQRALDAGRLEVDLVDLRGFGAGAYRRVDDAPFGGGPGMVLMPEPVVNALESVDQGHRVVLTPAGRPLDQALLDELSEKEHLVLVCGRYEGIDQRVADHYADAEVSLGDFVVAGGEIAAAAIVEGVARLQPDVLGNEASVVSESFRNNTLEEPHYTRPAEFRGHRVPDVLLSGNHAAIERWREEERERRTREQRPDLVEGDSQSE